MKEPRSTNVEPLSQERLPVNNWPLNRLAKEWLEYGRLLPTPDYPYILQLIVTGLEHQEVQLPGQGGQYREDLTLAAGRLLSQKIDPAKFVRWLTSNPNGPELQEQSSTLENALQRATTWQMAAQAAMETFYDRLAAENDHYRP